MLEKIKNSSLSMRIVVGSIIGIFIGFAFGESTADIQFLGDIFLRSVKMCVPLLIFCSIVEASASLPLQELKSVGFKTLGVFFVSTSLSAVLSVIVAKFFPPVLNITVPGKGAYEGAAVSESIQETLVNFIPDNAVAALANGTIVQIIIFAALFGISVNILKENNPAVNSVYEFTLGLRKVIMQIVTIVMIYAPIGISAMIAGVIGTSGVSALTSLGQILLLVSIVDIIFFAVYTLYMSVRYKLNIVQLLKNSSSIILMAFTTTSSAVTLPVALNEVPNKMGVKERISDFVLPLGNALNTNGAPISNILSAVACASIFDIEFTTSKLILLGVFAIVASFGNPGVPGGGIVSMAIVFQMIGIPVEGVAVFAGLDYFYSLTRAPLNVMGNVYSSIIVSNKLDEFDKNVFND
ncbi:MULTISPECIES: dicarboxylate/amino acid:cation symporter [Vagococcus]|uniref:dicarboxylate/amino acid:cation symporter n=1 Tax=Vagococcus TaxID=2737 RepID=UPI000E494728|nr:MULTISPECIES: dicarboxylate/amino acid:cation symporter [Vagococcus]RHH70193.1 dicarboxylate/amino acid:cation symporter [Vagococcus sp. AM17-17]